MEYLEFLEHMRTLLHACHDFEVRTAPPGCVALPSLFQKIVESEIQNEHQRGELALKLAEKKESQEPFRCTQCGDAIWYGERQHVCRGGKS